MGTPANTPKCRLKSQPIVESSLNSLSLELTVPWMDSISVKPLLDSVEAEGLAEVCASQLGLVAKASATTAGRKTNNLMGSLLFIIYGPTLTSFLV
jgi:hypothetical protein